MSDPQNNPLAGYDVDALDAAAAAALLGSGALEGHFSSAPHSMTISEALAQGHSLGPQGHIPSTAPEGSSAIGDPSIDPSLSGAGDLEDPYHALFSSKRFQNDEVDQDAAAVIAAAAAAGMNLPPMRAGDQLLEGDFNGNGGLPPANGYGIPMGGITRNFHTQNMGAGSNTSGFTSHNANQPGTSASAPAGASNQPPTSNLRKRPIAATEEDDDDLLDAEGEEDDDEDDDAYKSEPSDAEDPYEYEDDYYEPKSRKKVGVGRRKSTGATQRAPKKPRTSEPGPSADGTTPVKRQKGRGGPTPCTHIDPDTGEQCPATFVRFYDLKRHEETKHPKGEAVWYPCAGCEKSFSRRDALIRHQKTIQACTPYLQLVEK